MKLVFNSKGEEIRAEYYPQKTKKDQGGRLISTKRPFILPVEDKNRCFLPTTISIKAKGVIGTGIPT